MKINMDVVYSFNDIQMSFGDLDMYECLEVFSDGRVCSHFLEHQLTMWFPELTRVDQKGFDHIRTVDNYKFMGLLPKDRKNFDGIKFDQKSFTKGGVHFMPSCQIGMGRSFDESFAHAHANNLIYIITDITDLPNIDLVFKYGSELIVEYPKCRIPYKDRVNLFNK